MVTLLRRVFWLAVIGGAGFAGWSAWGRRNTPAKAGPPEWPPIEPPAGMPPAATDPAATTSSTAQAGTAPTVPLLDEPLLGETLLAEPPEHSTSGALTWVASDGGTCPSSHPIKANNNSWIFHVPGGRFYDQTRAERCYALAEDAEADGYRRAKS